MINYHQPVFRPPAEANSIIIQVALGCSFNKCSFCSMYETKKFQIRTLEEIFLDIDKLSYYDDTRRVFLADGDALACDTTFLVNILKYLLNKNDQYLLNIKDQYFINFKQNSK